MSTDVFGLALLAAIALISAPWIWGMLRHWVHPLRVLAQTLDIAFLLLIVSLTAAPTGWAEVLWWVVLVASLLAAVTALWRASRSDPPTPDSSPTKAQARRLRMARPPSTVTLVLNGVLLLALLGVAFWAG